MTLNELLLAQTIESIRRRNLQFTEPDLGVELREGGAPRAGGVRHAVAASLVRAGLLLDGRAAAIAARPAQQAAPQEASHAL